MAAAAGAAVVVVGLTERWRREGLGPARTALATRGCGSCLARPPRGAPAVGSRLARPIRASPGRSPPDSRPASSDPPSIVKRVRRRCAQEPTRMCRVRQRRARMLHLKLYAQRRCARLVRGCHCRRIARRSREYVQGLPASRSRSTTEAGTFKMKRRPARRLGDHLLRGDACTPPYYHAQGHGAVRRAASTAVATARARATRRARSPSRWSTGRCSRSADPASLVWGACCHPIVSRAPAPSPGARGVIHDGRHARSRKGVTTGYIGNLTLKGHAAQRAHCARRALEQGLLGARALSPAGRVATRTARRGLMRWPGSGSQDSR